MKNGTRVEDLNFNCFFLLFVGTGQDLKLAGAEYKEKKIQIDIHIVLKNYKYLKSLFLNTLRCNNLPTNTNKNKIMSFFHTRLSRIFFFFLVRAFTLIMLKILTFSTPKSYFIYFIISLYNTLNIKCSIFFFITSFKII